MNHFRRTAFRPVTCNYWKNGTCLKGSKCNFVHGYLCRDDGMCTNCSCRDTHVKQRDPSTYLKGRKTFRYNNFSRNQRSRSRSGSRSSYGSPRRKSRSPYDSPRKRSRSRSIRRKSRSQSPYDKHRRSRSRSSHGGSRRSRSTKRSSCSPYYNPLKAKSISPIISKRLSRSHSSHPSTSPIRKKRSARRSSSSSSSGSSVMSIKSPKNKSAKSKQTKVNSSLTTISSNVKTKSKRDKVNCSLPVNSSNLKTKSKQDKANTSLPASSSNLKTKNGGIEVETEENLSDVLVIKQESPGDLYDNLEDITTTPNKKETTSFKPVGEVLPLKTTDEDSQKKPTSNNEFSPSTRALNILKNLPKDFFNAPKVPEKESSDTDQEAFREAFLKALSSTEMTPASGSRKQVETLPPVMRHPLNAESLAKPFQDKLYGVEATNMETNLNLWTPSLDRSKNKIVKNETSKDSNVLTQPQPTSNWEIDTPYVTRNKQGNIPKPSLSTAAVASEGKMLPPPSKVKTLPVVSKKRKKKHHRQLSSSSSSDDDEVEKSKKEKSPKKEIEIGEKGREEALEKKKDILSRVWTLMGQKKKLEMQREDIMINNKGDGKCLASLLQENSLLSTEIDKQIFIMNQMVQIINSRLGISKNENHQQDFYYQPKLFNESEMPKNFFKQYSTQNLEKSVSMFLNPANNSDKKSGVSPSVKKAKKLDKSKSKSRSRSISKERKRSKSAEHKSKKHKEKKIKKETSQIIEVVKPQIKKDKKKDLKKENKKSFPLQKMNPGGEVEYSPSPSMKPHIKYIDQGMHWCKICNDFLDSVEEYISHLQSVNHLEKLKFDSKPWMPPAPKIEKDHIMPDAPVLTIPLKGLEFTHSLTAYYCSLCENFIKTKEEVEVHSETKFHVSKYKEYLSSNPMYETCYIKEKMAAYAKYSVDKERSRERASTLEETNQEAFFCEVKTRMTTNIARPMSESQSLSEEQANKNSLDNISLNDDVFAQHHKSGNISNNDGSENITNKYESENNTNNDGSENFTNNYGREDITNNDGSENLKNNDESEKIKIDDGSEITNNVESENIAHIDDGENITKNDENENITKNDENENITKNDVSENITINDKSENITKYDKSEIIKKNDDRESITNIDEGENIANIEEKENITSIDERKNITSIDKRKNITSIDKRKNITSIDERKNITSIDKRKNITSIDERKNITSIDERKNITSIDERKSITSVDERDYITSIDERDNITNIEGRENITNINDEKENITNVDDERENITNIVERENIANIDEMEKIKNKVESENRPITKDDKSKIITNNDESGDISNKGKSENITKYYKSETRPIKKNDKSESITNNDESENFSNKGKSENITNNNNDNEKVNITKNNKKVNITKNYKKTNITKNNEKVEKVNITNDYEREHITNIDEKKNIANNEDCEIVTDNDDETITNNDIDINSITDDYDKIIKKMQDYSDEICERVNTSIRVTSRALSASQKETEPQEPNFDASKLHPQRFSEDLEYAYHKEKGISNEDKKKIRALKTRKAEKKNKRNSLPTSSITDQHSRNDINEDSNSDFENKQSKKQLSNIMIGKMPFLKRTKFNSSIKINESKIDENITLDLGNENSKSQPNISGAEERIQKLVSEGIDHTSQKLVKKPVVRQSSPECKSPSVEYITEIKSSGEEPLFIKKIGPMKQEIQSDKPSSPNTLPKNPLKKDEKISGTTQNMPKEIFEANSNPNSKLKSKSVASNIANNSSLMTISTPPMQAPFPSVESFVKSPKQQVSSTITSSSSLMTVSQAPFPSVENFVKSPKQQLSSTVTSNPSLMTLSQPPPPMQAPFSSMENFGKSPNLQLSSNVTSNSSLLTLSQPPPPIKAPFSSIENFGKSPNQQLSSSVTSNSSLINLSQPPPPPPPIQALPPPIQAPPPPMQAPPPPPPMQNPFSSMDLIQKFSGPFDQQMTKYNFPPPPIPCVDLQFSRPPPVSPMMRPNHPFPENQSMQRQPNPEPQKEKLKMPFLPLPPLPPILDYSKISPYSRTMEKHSGNPYNNSNMEQQQPGISQNHSMEQQSYNRSNMEQHTGRSYNYSNVEQHPPVPYNRSNMEPTGMQYNNSNMDQRPGMSHNYSNIEQYPRMLNNHPNMENYGFGAQSHSNMDHRSGTYNQPNVNQNPATVSMSNQLSYGEPRGSQSTPSRNQHLSVQSNLKNTNEPNKLIENMLEDVNVKAFTNAPQNNFNKGKTGFKTSMTEEEPPYSVIQEGLELLEFADESVSPPSVLPDNIKNPNFDWETSPDDN